MSYIGAEPTTAAFPFDQFSGTGAATAFTLTQAPAGNTSVIVYVGGAVQNPNTYTIVGTTITFSVAPVAGTNNIGVLLLGLPALVGVPNTGTVTPAMLSTGGPVWDTGGTLTAVNLKPVTDNTGVIGDAALTWSNGQFTSLTVDSTLTVRAAIDLADSDVLRMGSSDDWALYYNGTTNKGQVEMEAACLGIQFTDNGTERAYIDKATGDFSATSFSGAGTGLTGTAASLTIGGSAATLTTGRTIAITGDLAYTSGSFNGSANVTGTGTLANSGVTAGSYTLSSITVDAKGRVTAASTGSAPAPTTAQVLSATAGASVGAVGSYAFLARVANKASSAAGTTVSGADLRYSNAYSNNDQANEGSNSVAPSGTWMIMGNTGFLNLGTANTNDGFMMTLFLRIS